MAQTVEVVTPIPAEGRSRKIRSPKVWGEARIDHIPAVNFSQGLATFKDDAHELP
jgi:hypothetical protein